MRVLVACEFSGRVRNAFLEKGHDAYSCDILTGRDPTHGRHYRQDVRPLLKEKWDLVIAHPPCTYLCNSGVRWLSTEPDRFENMKKGAEFFLECLSANSDRVAVENPIMHKYAREIVTVPYTQIVQPYNFGHPETKATCLWLKNLPLLQPTQVVSNVKRSIHQMPPIAIKGWRGHLRSVTFQGIADAMAEQWGST